jgi:general secretion pathway protein N
MPWSWAIAGLAAGVLAAIVCFAPARWLASRVQVATNGQVLVLEPRGTIWNGTGQLVLSGGAGSSDAIALPSRVEWHLRPTLAGVGFRIATACCTPQPVQGRVAWGWGRTRLLVEDSRTTWPAALLSGLGTPWNTMQIEGDLDLQTRGLVLEWTAGRLAVAGQAELTAARVASRLATVRPMGSYRLALAGGTVPGLQLSTLDGPLQLRGSGQWVGGRLRFSGEASAAPDREAALGNLLNIIGRREGARSIITIG